MILKGLRNDGQHLLVYKSRDGILYLTLVFSQQGTYAKKVGRMRAAYWLGH